MRAGAEEDESPSALAWVAREAFPPPKRLSLCFFTALLCSGSAVTPVLGSEKDSGSAQRGKVRAGKHSTSCVDVTSLAGALVGLTPSCFMESLSTHSTGGGSTKASAVLYTPLCLSHTEESPHRALS